MVSPTRLEGAFLELRTVVAKANAFITRNIRRKSAWAERKVGSIPGLDEICLHYSMRRLERRKEAERSLKDIIETVGTAEDLFLMYDEFSIRHPLRSLGLTSAGKYRGWGKYRTIKASQYRAEICGIARAAKRHEPKTVVEIGTARGGSLYVWARYLKSADLLVSLDLDHRGMEAFFERFSVKKEITCISGNSHSNETRELVEITLNGREIDFLYLDGDHRYEAVKQDFETYRPLMAEDGIVGFNDVEDNHPGVVKFWEELDALYKTELFGQDEGTSGLVYLS